VPKSMQQSILGFEVQWIHSEERKSLNDLVATSQILWQIPLNLTLKVCIIIYFL